MSALERSAERRAENERLRVKTVELEAIGAELLAACHAVFTPINRYGGLTSSQGA